ncbi:hypothetical protein FOZ62_000458 [Perkinsus olseni]|nr:hypothetical protein FOZ62_000458 [Perkinsus olseni]
MESSKKKPKEAVKKPTAPQQPPVVASASQAAEAGYPSSICTESTAPSASEGHDVRQYSGVVTAAIDYDHDEDGVARMKRGDRFHCRKETKNLFLGHKEGSKELLWLPKFVVTGDLRMVKGG